RVSFWHVFVASDRRGTAAEDEARVLLARLRSEAEAPAQAARLGVGSPPGGRFAAPAERDPARPLPGHFAPAGGPPAPGPSTGPPRSPCGGNVVRTEEKTPARTQAFEAVRSRVLAQVIEDRAEAHLAEALRLLRTKYTVRIGAPGGGPG